MIPRTIAATLLCWTTAFSAAAARAETGFGDVGALLTEARLSPAPAAPAETPAAAPLVPGFCSAPSAFVCGSGGEVERTRAVAAEQGDFRSQALESTLEYVGVPKSRWPEFTEEADLNAKLPAADRVKAYRFYYKQMRESLRDYLAKNDLPADYGMTQLKANMKAAIEGSSDIAPALRQKMAAIVDATRMITIADYASDVELRAGDLSIAWRGCGADQLVDDDFSTRGNSGERLIVVCPGSLIGTIQYNKLIGLPHELILSGLTFVLAHEIGHQFDAITEDFKRAYGSTLSLLEKNQPGLHPGTPAENYMSESTADLWGDRTLAVALGAVADPAVRGKVLVENFSTLCGSEDDKAHPSGTFRFDVLAPAALCR